MRLKGNQIEPDGTLPLAALEGHGIALALLPLLGFQTVYYVDANDTRAEDSAKCGTDYRPWATLAYAVTQAVANSTIIVKAGHTESVASDAFAWGAAGIKVIGLGSGDERPTFTFTTSTAAAMQLDVANLAIVNLRFINAIASQAVIVNASGAGTLIAGCFFQVGDATTQAVTGIGVGGDNTKVIDNEIVTTTDAGAQGGIWLSGTPNNVEVARNWVYGDFSEACIHNPTGNILTLLNIHDNVLTNLQSGDHAIQLVSACTGCINRNIVNCSLSAVADPQGIDCGACFANENYGSDATDQSGVLTPAVDAA
ncbi:MAG: hypothetical protein ACYTG0_25015 [Planctomycetota bacterium]|jgi:hypothetical protein